MEYKDLKELLKRYYEGMSSSEEEMELKQILKEMKTEKEFQSDALLFAGLEENDIPEPDAGFEARLMTGIEKHEENRGIIRLKRRIYAITSVAAVLLILISAWFIISANTLKDTYDDPVLAYNETREILRLVSDGMNSGREQLNDLSVINVATNGLQIMKEPQSLISKELEPLRMINKSLNAIGINK